MKCRQGRKRGWYPQLLEAPFILRRTVFRVYSSHDTRFRSRVRPHDEAGDLVVLIELQGTCKVFVPLVAAPAPHPSDAGADNDAVGFSVRAGFCADRHF